MFSIDIAMIVRVGVRSAKMDGTTFREILLLRRRYPWLMLEAASSRAKVTVRSMEKKMAA